MIHIIHKWGKWEYLNPARGHHNWFQVKRCIVCGKVKQTTVV